ncbi:hypothetical protein C8R45DRAFT_72437 [Mycena sanguinolenta]|nr:hypothetical protein C8R45DRAFT_72437 [Mycena sanguinolenta]
MRFLRLSPRIYSRIWIPAALVPTVLAAYTNYRLDKERSGPGLTIFLLFVLSIGLRLWQFFLALLGWYFTAEMYDLWRILFLVLFSLITILYVLLSTTYGLPCSQWIGLTILSNIVIWLVERYAVGFVVFQQYMLGRKVIECLRQIAVKDSIAFREKYDFYAAWARILSPFFKIFKVLRVLWSRFIRVKLGPIALLDDDDEDNREEENNAVAPDLEPGTSSSGSGSGSTSRARVGPMSHNLPAQFSSNLTHWSLLGPEWHSTKALWITADSLRVRDRIVHTALEHFRMRSRISSTSTSDDSAGGQTTTAEVHIVDVSGAPSVAWPLIHGLALASAAYRNEIAKNPPDILSERYPWYPYSRCFDVTTWGPPPEHYYDEEESGRKVRTVHPAVCQSLGCCGS